MAIGSNFKVNDDSHDTNQEFPSIDIDKYGNFVIVWQDHRNGQTDIYAQRYDFNGTPLGSNFKVNDDSIGAWQFFPSISFDGSVIFFIVWQDNRNDAIYMRKGTILTGKRLDTILKLTTIIQLLLSLNPK